MQVDAVDVRRYPQKMPFSVFSDQVDNFSPSGWMGDVEDLHLNLRYTSDPGEGKVCLQIIYRPKNGVGAGWVGVYWQAPANNWGTSREGGYDLTWARKIRFKAKGSRGEELIRFNAGGITGPYPDTFKTSMQTVTLTTAWKDYEISLTSQNLGRVIGGFCFTIPKDGNPEGCVFYLDDIRYSTF